MTIQMTIPIIMKQRYRKLYDQKISMSYNSCFWCLIECTIKVKSANEQCNCNHILFTKLPWSEESEGTFQSSSQATTCPPVYHTRWRLHTVSLIAEHQAGKL